MWKLVLDAGDRDGYISRIEIMWGDGARQLIELPLSACDDPGGHWPSSRRVVPVDHRFPTEDRAQHTITVSVTSVGCDGGDAQVNGGFPYARTSQQY